MDADESSYRLADVSEAADLGCDFTLNPCLPKKFSFSTLGLRQENMKTKPKQHDYLMLDANVFM